MPANLLKMKLCTPSDDHVELVIEAASWPPKINEIYTTRGE